MASADSANLISAFVLLRLSMEAGKMEADGGSACGSKDPCSRSSANSIRVIGSCLCWPEKLPDAEFSERQAPGPIASHVCQCRQESMCGLIRHGLDCVGFGPNEGQDKNARMGCWALMSSHACMHIGRMKGCGDESGMKL